MEKFDPVTQTLKVLSDRKCLEILKTLSIKPSYNKELGELLRVPETRISEKVKIMKAAGLISEYWTVSNRKPVKMYRLNVDRISLSIQNGKISAVSSLNDQTKQSLSLDSYKSRVPHISKFVGRKEELEILKGNDHVFITGLHGIGKTTLLAKYASVAGAPVFWHRIREIDTLRHLIMKLAVFLKECGNEEPINLIKNETDYRFNIDVSVHNLRKTGVTVIIDDLHKCRDPEIISFVQDLVLTEPKIQVKIISRDPLPVRSDSIYTLRLGGLDMTSASELLGHEADSEDVFRITGGHPLMIKLFSSLYGRVKNVDWRSKSFLFREILDALGKNLSEVLHNLSFFRGDVLIDELDSIFGRSDHSVLEEAEYLGFLRFRENKITMSDFVREVVYDMTDAKHDIHGRIASYYLQSEKAEYQIEGLYHILRSGNDGRIVDSLNRAIPALIDSGYLENMLAELERSLVFVGQGLATEWIRLWMGKILLMKGKQEEALNLFHQIRKNNLNLELKVKAMSGESQVYEERGDPTRSMEILQEALNLVSGHDEILEANLLLNLSGPLVMGGRIALAHSYLQRAIAAYQAKGELRNLYVSLANFAWTTYLSGAVDDALSTIDQAIEGFLSANAFYSYADCIVEKAIFLSASGKLSWADDLFQEAIEIFESTAYNPRDLIFAFAYKIMNDIRSDNLEKGRFDLRTAARMSGTNSDQSTLGLIGIAEAQLLFKGRKYSKALLKLRSAKELLSNDFPSLCLARLTEYTIMLSKGDYKEADSIASELVGDLKSKGCAVFLKSLENIRKEITA